MVILPKDSEIYLGLANRYEKFIPNLRVLAGILNILMMLSMPDFDKSVPQDKESVLGYFYRKLYRVKI
jgi:hypothetical protein